MERNGAWERERVGAGDGGGPRGAGIYVRTYVCTHVRTYLRAYVRTYVRTCVCTYVRTRLWLGVPMPTFVQICYVRTSVERREG